MAIRQEQLGLWTQIVTSVAVILGLALVVWELNQTRSLSRSQLASDSWGIGSMRASTFVGEAPMAVWAKACQGEALTVQEALILDNALLLYTSPIRRSQEIESIAGFDTERWKRQMDGLLRVVFSTEHGRAWWAARKSSYNNPELEAWADGILADSHVSCMQRLEPLLNAHL